MPLACSVTGCRNKVVFIANGKPYCAKCYCREHGIKLPAEQPSKETAERTK